MTFTILLNGLKNVGNIPCSLASITCNPGSFDLEIDVEPFLVDPLELIANVVGRMTKIVLLQDSRNSVGLHVPGGDLHRTAKGSIHDDRVPHVMAN